MSPPRVAWPEGKAFAFTVFDDTDSQTLEKGRAVYSYLADLDFRTTKSVWMLAPTEPTTDLGANCEDPAYLAFVKKLQSRGFEIGYHMASATTATRDVTIKALDAFRREFGHDPRAMANHYASHEDVYFGEARVSGLNRLAYNVLTRFRNRGLYRGHVTGDPLFWADICRERIRYVRSFTFAEINTLKVCPMMPYHDPDRPLVNAWFASSEGDRAESFLDRISEANQDRLEEEGGACVMYTHFGLGFVRDGQLLPRFRQLMERLRRKNGWFVPVTTLLDYLAAQAGPRVIKKTERAALERRWLRHKVWFGSA